MEFAVLNDVFQITYEKDCCDGTDEKAGVCSNTCRELAEETIKEQKELYIKYKKGLELKKQYSEESMEDLEFKKEDLAMYKAQLENYKSEKNTVEGRQMAQCQS